MTSTTQMQHVRAPRIDSQHEWFIDAFWEVLISPQCCTWQLMWNSPHTVRVSARRAFPVNTLVFFVFLLASKNDVHFPFLFVLSFCPFLSWHLEENLHSQYCFILPKRTEADKRLVPLSGALFLLSPPECWAFHDYLWGMGSSETTNFLLLDLSDLYVSSAFFLICLIHSWFLRNLILSLSHNYNSYMYFFLFIDSHLVILRQGISVYDRQV